MIQLSELLPPRPEASWKLIRQVGVDNVVGVLNGAEQDQRMFQSVGAGGWTADDRDEIPWSEKALAHNIEVYADYGFRLIATEDTAPLDKARLGLDGRDEQIDHVIEQVRAMGRLGIPTLAYNWMALSSWGRTNIADTESMPRLVEEGEVSREQMWDALAYFLAAVVPEAEAAGVRLAMHPDDPPQPFDRNLPRIMSSVEAFRRLLAMHPSPANGITLCQGNFALMPEVLDGTTPIPAVIREFGADRIPFVHFRDVRGTPVEFQETFHDAGQTDMPACMEAYQEIGFAGAMRPDHVPTLEGELNSRPGYETLGRLFAIGYIRGLEQSVYGHPSTRGVA
jgi:mannonate dehydratase